MATFSVRKDDFDGVSVLSEDATATVITVQDGRETFSVELDLSDENFKKLLTAVRKFRDVGRTVATKRPAKPAAGSSNAGAVREWARENGFTVNDRGAIPADVKEAYAHAHPVADNEPGDVDE